MLPDFGLEEGRFRLAWISAAEGVQFAELMTEFTEQIRRLGPSPYNRGQGRVAAKRDT
jgi:F420-non-reducing hydrogenase iron-sulfur subunit